MNSSPHSQLFSPLKIGNLTLPNRVVMAPMSTNLGGQDGSVTPELIAFYKARAEGGTGMIIVEFCSVQRRTGRSEECQLSLEDESFLPGHRELVNTITAAGSVACLQLQHGGPGIKRSLVEGGIAVGPSDVPSRKDPTKLTARALTDDEIEELIECFGRTAELAIEAGYQAIELHGAHGYLLTSFISPFINHRSDKWGGDRLRRLEFPRRVIERVKQAIGERPLSFRLSADEFTPAGNSREEMIEIAKELEGFGVDMLHVSIGLGATSFDKIIEPMSMPEGWRLPYARAIKQAVSVPVISVGQIRWPATANQAIANGDCDLIALGRPLLADPSWANKAKADQPFRPCTSCNYCITLSDSEMGHIGCAENPATGRELEPELDAGHLKGQCIAVIGGGPGGMAAALMLQQAGFKTHLFEARQVLGGGLIASAAPPFKEKLNWYNDYLRDRLSESNVTVHMGSPADLPTLQALNPKLVLMANGGSPLKLSIPGDQHPHVLDAYELLMGTDLGLPNPDSEHPVLVYGGGETGCECAEYLAERGYRVVLVSRSPARQLARSAEMIYRGVLLQRLHANPAIEILDNTELKQIDERGFARTLNSETNADTVVAASRVIIAQGRRPDPTLFNQLQAAHIPVVAIGDARRGGRIGDAVHDAYLAAQKLCNSANSDSTLAV